MARSRVVRTAWAAVLVAISLTVLGTASAGSSGAAASGTTGAHLRTLVESRLQIRAFAQDGDRIAWISPLRKHGRPAGCALRIRDLRSGRTSVTLLGSEGCPSQRVWQGALALAGRSAAWVQGAWCGNTECSWVVSRATEGDRRARLVERTTDHYCIGASCEGNYNQPLLAGAGQLIAYSYGALGEVRRIVADGVRRLFPTSGEIAGVAVAGGRAGAVSLTLGGGSGLLDSPAWSPDGTKVAVAHGKFYVADSSDYPIAVMNADGTELHDLPSSATCLAGHYYPRAGLAWSPDGQKIASEDCWPRIRVANVDGSGGAVLTNGGGPAWSPDGSKIAFERDGRNNATPAIYVMSPDGSNVHELASFGTGAGAVGPLSWSPDGTRIAFSLGGLLEVMNADGSTPHQLGSATGTEPTWSPDSSRIAFRATSGLFVIGADETGLRRLTSGQDDHPSWSPDGKTIVFSRWAFTTSDQQELMDLYAVAPDGSNLRPFGAVDPVRIESTTIVRSSKGRTTFAAPGTPAGLALTDERAAVGSVDGGIDQITVFDASTGKKLASVKLGDHQRGFSVDGANAHWIVFHVGATISVLNVSSRQISRLTTAALPPSDLSVSGRRVAWLERLRGGSYRIRALDLPS